MNDSNWRQHADLSVDGGGVATLTIANAGSLNILGTPVINSLQSALAEAARNPAIRVLALRGSKVRDFVHHTCGLATSFGRSSAPLETAILNGIDEFAQAFDTGEPQRYMGDFIQAKQKNTEP